MYFYSSLEKNLAHKSAYSLCVDFMVAQGWLYSYNPKAGYIVEFMCWPIQYS